MFQLRKKLRDFFRRRRARGLEFENTTYSQESQNLRSEGREELHLEAAMCNPSGRLEVSVEVHANGSASAMCNPPVLGQTSPDLSSASNARYEGQELNGGGDQQRRFPIPVLPSASWEDRIQISDLSSASNARSEGHELNNGAMGGDQQRRFPIYRNARDSPATNPTRPDITTTTAAPDLSSASNSPVYSTPRGERGPTSGHAETSPFPITETPPMTTTSTPKRSMSLGNPFAALYRKFSQTRTTSEVMPPVTTTVQASRANRSRSRNRQVRFPNIASTLLSASSTSIGQLTADDADIERGSQPTVPQPTGSNGRLEATRAEGVGANVALSPLAANQDEEQDNNDEVDALLEEDGANEPLLPSLMVADDDVDAEGVGANVALPPLNVALSPLAANQDEEQEDNNDEVEAVQEEDGANEALLPSLMVADDGGADVNDSTDSSNDGDQEKNDDESEKSSDSSEKDSEKKNGEKRDDDNDENGPNGGGGGTSGACGGASDERHHPEEEPPRYPNRERRQPDRYNPEGPHRRRFPKKDSRRYGFIPNMSDVPEEVVVVAQSETELEDLLLRSREPTPEPEWDAFERYLSGQPSFDEHMLEKSFNYKEL